MKTARDVMEWVPVVVTPDTTVKELAEILDTHRLDGVAVEEGGALVGVVTSMDLIYQEKKVHMPTFFAFMDALIPVSGMKHTLEEIEKISGSTVREIMSRSPRSVSPETPLADLATMMVEEHFTVLPVVENGRTIGMVTKPALLRAAYGL